MASCQFNPEAIAIWADRKSICFLSDAQREDAYLRAVPFLLEQMKALIEKGWTQISEKPNNDGILFDLSRDGEERLTLPSTFNAFLDTSKEHTWRTTFTDPWVFLAAWKDDDEMDLFVDSSPPLCNIFYLLQALAPGMLVIRRDAIVDLWKRAVSRAVPQKSWIEEHYHSLEEVMGSTKAMNALLSAAEDQNAMAYDDELENARSDEESDTDDREYDYHGYLSWDQDDESSYVNMWGFREPYDLTACSSECGYCGRCDY